MRGSNIANVGAYPISYGPLAKGVEIMTSIYHVPAVHFRARAAITNTLPTRPYRSSGRPEVMFVMERLIDLAARQYGFNRLELRRRNLVPESAMPYRNPFGMVYDSGAYHNVMERGFRLGARKPKRAANTAGSASAITSTLRPEPRASAPKSPYCRTRSWKSSSAPCRTARVTKPALRS
jgi:carbon-monoxide dehydrogenase large subunit